MLSLLGRLTFRGPVAFPLPGLRSKADICRSVDALTAPERNTTPEDEEVYKDALWAYVAYFRNRRTRRLNPLAGMKTTAQGVMRFAHSICTDGYSVTIVCTDQPVRGRHGTFRSGVSSRKRKPTQM